MHGDHSAATGQVSNSAAIERVNALGAAPAERALCRTARRRGSQMERLALPPHTVNPHAGYGGKEQLGEHGASCLSPEIITLWSLRLPPFGRIQSAHEPHRHRPLHGGSGLTACGLTVVISA